MNLRKRLKSRQLEKMATQHDAVDMLYRARYYLEDRGRLDFDTWALLDDRISACLDAIMGLARTGDA